MQGDVIAVYSDTGTKLVSYRYDAWGNVTTTYHNGGASTLAANNPIRYRGYYYDTDLGMYYLQSRYYDSKICRFINADCVIACGEQSMQSCNMFVYCFNNPVNMSDVSGAWPSWLITIANWIDENIVQSVSHFFDSSTNTIGGQFSDGIFYGTGTLTCGYSEVNNRMQINVKDSNSVGMVGIFEKLSIGNASGKIGIGNDNVALSLKSVVDGLTATLQFGMQYKNGVGVAAKAKAAMLSGRLTTELTLYGYQIELGISGDLLSVGMEAMIGVFPGEGFTTKASLGVGPIGGGFVFRVKPI